MGLNLTRFYQVCDPSQTLDVSNPDDQPYYIDFSPVRGSNLIQELDRTITRLSPNVPTCQLFTGHIGCGKSTELHKLKANLTAQDFHVVYFESSEDLDLADVDITDILLAIARQVSESLETLNIHLRPNYFVSLVKELGEILQTPVEITDVKFSAWIASITAQVRDSTTLRSRLRQFMEPRTNGILEAINTELIKPAIAALQRQGYQNLVVIIDNLDRLDLTRPSGDRSQPTYLFIDRGDQLKKLKCHVVYTIPLALAFSNDLSRLANCFGADPKILPMVPVRFPDGRPDSQGLELMRQMVLVRAFPELAVSDRWAEVQQVFDSTETLDRLCFASGGHVRTLLMLLNRGLQRTDPPFSRDCIERVIRERRNDLLLAITDEEMALLKQVKQRRNVRGEEGYQTLVRSMFVYEYRSEHGNWFEVNPILAEAQELNP